MKLDLYRNVAVPLLIAGVCALLVVVAFSDVKEIAQSMRAIDLRTLAIVLALSLLNYALRFARWALYLDDRSTPVPFGRHFMIYLAGFALTPTPSKVGEALRALYLKPFGIGYGRCLAALYAERLLDLIVVSLLAALMFTAADAITRWLGLIGVGIAVGLIACQHPAVVTLVERIIRRLPSRRLAAAGGAVTAFLNDVRSMLTARLVTSGAVLGFLAWGAEGFGLYLVAQAMSIEVGLLPAIGIYATAMLAGAVSFLPGGLGSTEVVMVSLFVSMGASPPAAIAATAVVRLATLWFAVALGAAAWLGIEAFRNAVFAGLQHGSDREGQHAEPRRDTGR